MHTPYRRSFVEISKSAFAHNVSQLRTILDPSATFAPVIKANAYGHGTREIAEWCQEYTVIDFICIALLSEAIALREAGITKPILVIGCIDTDPTRALHKNIHLFIYSMQTALQLHHIATQYKSQFLIHIKIDTGLSRLGFLYTDAVQQIKQISLLTGIAIMGIYSHFAEAQAENPEFCHLQITRFQAVVAELKQNNINPTYRHISNSAATLRFKIPECNLFRLGAIIYGLWPSQQTKKEALEKFPTLNLKPVLTWKSHIMHIQEIPTGSFVGYNRTHQTTQYSRIATIPVGYQDGYDIQFSNNAQVMIGSTIAPVVGRICMNHFMVDVTNIPHASIGTVVTLLGPDHPIDVYSLAKLSSNNNVRELLTHINPGFERKIVE